MKKLSDDVYVEEPFKALYCHSCLKEFPIEAIYRPSLGYYRHVRICSKIRSKAMDLLHKSFPDRSLAMPRYRQRRYKGSNGSN